MEVKAGYPESICVNEEKIYIESIAKYAEYLHEIYSLQQNNYRVNKKFYFRGHSDIEWKLIPSLLRTERWEDEYEIIKDCYRRYQSWFENLDINNNGDLLQIMIKLQHYGIATRLLDFTEDPMVALYFACEDNFEKDGEIFVSQEYVGRNSSKERDSILKFVRNGLNIVLEAENEQFINDINENAVIIEPYINNERIKAQKGLFYLFGMKVNTSDINRVTFDIFDIEKKMFLDNSDQNNPIRKKIIVPKNSKLAILNELDKVYRINRHAVYPELDVYGKYLKESESLQEKVIEKQMEELVLQQIEDIFDFTNYILSFIESSSQKVGFDEKNKLEIRIKVDKNILDKSPFQSLIINKQIQTFILELEETNLLLAYALNDELDDGISLLGFQYKQNNYYFNSVIMDYNTDNVEISINKDIIMLHELNEPNSKSEKLIEKKETKRYRDNGKDEFQNNVNSEKIHRICIKIVMKLVESKNYCIEESQHEIYNILKDNLMYGRREDIAQCEKRIKRYFLKTYGIEYKNIFNVYKEVVSDLEDEIRNELQ